MAVLDGNIRSDCAHPAAGGWRRLLARGAGGASAAGGAGLRAAVEWAHRPADLQDCPLPHILCGALRELPQ